MKRTCWSTAALLTGFVTVAIAGQPGRPPGPPGRGPGGPMGPPPLERLLQLTAQQQEAFKTLRAEEREALRPFFEEQRSLHKKLREALDTETPDAMTVGQLVIDAHAVQARIEEAHAAFREKLAAILTPEQQETLKTLPGAGVRARRGRGMFMPFPGPPPPPPGTER